MQQLLDAAKVFVDGVSFGDPNLRALNDWLMQQEAARRADYDLFRAYYAGDHPTELTDRLKKFLNGGLVNGKVQFRDNFCEVVVDALAERLQVTAFDTNEPDMEGEEKKPIASWAWDVWEANRMDEVSGVVHTEAAMVGDSYILVAWDPIEKRVTFQKQLPELCMPHYNEETGKIDVVSKKWIETGIGKAPLTRLNLYYADRVEKYRVDGNTWVHHTDPGETGWPQPWKLSMDADGEPLGVPIFHFRNKPAGADFGQSELHNATPTQDLLNKTLIDLAMINDNAGFGRAYTVNMNVDASAVDMIPGAWWNLKSEDEGNVGSSVGHIPADSPDGALKTIEMLVQHIAGTTRTPQYLFQLMGGAPSGESLKVAESGLVAKAKDRQVKFGNSWEDVMRFALRVQQAFGGPLGLPPPGGLDTRFDVQWADPATRNEESHLTALKSKMELGIPEVQLWREMGYDQDTIEQMLKDQSDDKVRSANVGSEILRSFTAGGLTGDEGLTDEGPVAGG